jgi:hypothetical protein
MGPDELHQAGAEPGTDESPSPSPSAAAELRLQIDTIKEVLAEATSTATIVAPFITAVAFDELLTSIPDSAGGFTRWLPSEVAVGVSDPTILEPIENRAGASSGYWIASTPGYSSPRTMSTPGSQPVNERAER